MHYAETRFGVPIMALAILAIVFGVLIIAFPALISWLVGVILIVLGVLALVGTLGGVNADATRARQAQPPRL